MKPVIAGPSMALTGTLTTLNCSSASHPPSHISWYFWNNSSPVGTTSELTIGPLTLNMSGKYICMAYNNITGRNSTAYTMLTVLGKLLPKNGSTYPHTMVVSYHAKTYTHFLHFQPFQPVNVCLSWWFNVRERLWVTLK